MINKLFGIEKSRHGAGLVSQISFQNPDFMKGLRVMFDVKPDEKIVEMFVTDDSIKVVFERVQE